MSTKYNVGDQVIATIGRKDVAEREQHPAEVTYVVPSAKLGATRTVTKNPDGTKTIVETPNPQSYLVRLTDVPKGVVARYDVPEDDLAPIAQ